MQSNRANYSALNLNFGFRRNNLNLLAIYVTCECRKAKVDVQFGRVRTLCFQQMQPNKFQKASNDFITLGYFQQKAKVGCIKGNFFRLCKLSSDDYPFTASLHPSHWSTKIARNQAGGLSFIIDEKLKLFFTKANPKGCVAAGCLNANDKDMEIEICFNMSTDCIWSTLIV